MKAIGHLNENSTSIIQFNQNVYKVLKATEILVYFRKKDRNLGIKYGGRFWISLLRSIEVSRASSTIRIVTHSQLPRPQQVLIFSIMVAIPVIRTCAAESRKIFCLSLLFFVFFVSCSNYTMMQKIFYSRGSI